MIKTVQDLRLKYICTGCGTCEVVCPTNSINMKIKQEQYFPDIDMKRCIGCSKCIDICPGIEENNKSLLNTYFSKAYYDKNIGYYQSNYIGYSKDSDIRFKCASGGLVSTILLYLLENKIIDGAIVTKQNPEDPLKTSSFIASTKRDIIDSIGSKYCPTHTVSIIKQLKNKKGKFAFVGLPCQIRGLRKLQGKYPWVRERIILTIGLFCSRGVTYKGIKFITHKFARGIKNVKYIQYRGDGWPGGCRISYFNKDFKIAHKDYWDPYFANYFFTPYRCLVCGDLFSEGADISLGDAWIPEIKKKDSIGTSVIIARTKKAEGFLLKLKEESILHLDPCPKKAVLLSQKGIIKRKKKGLYARRILFRVFMKPIPKDRQNYKYYYKDFIMGAIMILNTMLSKRKIVQRILLKLPKKLLLRYTKLLHKLG